MKKNVKRLGAKSLLVILLMAAALGAAVVEWKVLSPLGAPQNATSSENASDDARHSAPEQSGAGGNASGGDTQTDRQGSPPAAEQVACQQLTAEVGEDNNYYFFTVQATGNTAAITGYYFDFGDGQTYLFNFDQGVRTGRSTASVEHTYNKPGVFRSRVSVLVARNGKTEPVSSDSCTQLINVSQVTTIPTTLVNAGPGQTLGLFGGTALTTALFRHIFITYRAGKNT